VWAAYTLVVKHGAVPLSPVAALATTVWLGLLMMSPVIWTRDIVGVAMELDVQAWSAVLYLGIAASIIAFGAWQAGVGRVSPARAGIFLQLIPVFSIAMSVWLLNETLTIQIALGGALVILGVTLAQLWRGQSRRAVRFVRGSRGGRAAA
ncbi:MAG: DMT family transporter, partial [Pseudomonadota bacterium]